MANLSVQTLRDIPVQPTFNTLPIQIIFRDLPKSATLEDRARQKAQKLFDRYHNQITHIKLVAEYAKKHLNDGKLFQIHLEIHTPGHTLVDTKQNPNIFAALKASFGSISRQLQDLNQIR